ncbi:MAG TPA: hypothetical protein VIM07_13070 [Chitinophagaceae bacterium]
MKYFFTSALLFVSIFCFAQSDVLRSKRIASVIKIDGDASEWSLPLRFYDKDTKLFFDFANDGNNLYLCFQSNDNAERMKIMRAGMTVTLKIKGGSKASIKFPLQPTAYDKNMMEVKGFKTKDGMIPINDNSGINAALGYENQKLSCEISIPLKELSGDDYVKDFEKDIELEVEVHPMKQNGSGGDRNFSGREGGGRMGGGGGMHRGVMNGGKQGNMQKSEDSNQEPKEDKTAMFEKTEFKQKFTLAKQ